MTRRHLFLLLLCAACAPVSEVPPLDDDGAPDAPADPAVPAADQGIVDGFGNHVTDGAENRVVP